MGAQSLKNLKDGAAMRAGHVKSKAPCLGRECLADGGTENCVSIGFPNRHENIQNLGQFDNVDLISVGNPSRARNNRSSNLTGSKQCG